MAAENTTLNPMEIMLQRRVAELEAKTALMQRLGTMQGFFSAYFEILKEHKTSLQAFETLNQQYFECWDVYRYQDYKSFCTQKNRYLKNNK